MANSLSTIGSIATFLANTYPGISSGVSGNLVIIVDSARQNVENYTNTAIGSNSIADTFQPAIVNFAKADLLAFINSQTGGEDIRLGDLSTKETGDNLSSEQYRWLAENALKNIGRDIKFDYTIS